MFFGGLVLRVHRLRESGDVENDFNRNFINYFIYLFSFDGVVAG